uniref:Uncharacterized protein n=1 Tax=Rhizophora mucronata TaxID=61149 RepID=A0A2P2NKT4_RHIMU
MVAYLPSTNLPTRLVDVTHLDDAEPSMNMNISSSSSHLAFIEETTNEMQAFLRAKAVPPY